MENIFLPTKLFIPRPKPNLVSRPRLTDHLNAALREGKQVIMINAPAGYGKTSLLSEWANQTDTAVAWITLDEQDNNPISLVTYLVAALGSIGLKVGSKIRNTLRLQREPPIRKILNALTYDILEFEQKFVLVLDDFHLLRNQDIIDALCDFVADMPETMHLIISGRTIPDIPCAKLKSQDKALHLEEAELRFTRAEIEKYFDQNAGLQLTPEEYNSIESQTEGWVTALQLLAIALQDQADVSGFIESISQAQQDVEQYLLEEVLSAQPEETQQFLLQSSLLDRFSKDLLEAVFEGYEPAEMIQETLDKKLFVIPLDERGEWYRYHHLFGEMLRKRFEGQYKDAAREIYEKAANWFRQRELWGEAIQQDIKGEIYPQAAKDIERGMKLYWKLGESSQLINWIQALPPDIIQKNPDIRLFLAWGRFLEGQVGEAFKSIMEIESCLREGRCARPLSEGEKKRLMGAINAMLSAVLCTSNQPSEAIAYSKQAQKLLPKDEYTWLGVSWNAQGVASRSIGNIDKAIEAFQRAAGTHQNNNNLYGLVVAYSALAEIYLHLGELQKVYETCQEALSALSKGDARFIPTGVIYLAMGKVLLEWGEYPLAEEYLVNSIDIFIEDRDMDCLLDAYFQLARLEHLRGNPQRAMQIMSMADTNIKRHQLPLLLSIRLRAYHARIFALVDQAHQAAVAFHALDWENLDEEQYEKAIKELLTGRVSAYMVSRNPRTYFMEFEQITQAMVLLFQGYPDAALPILSKLNGRDDVVYSQPGMLNIEILKALAYLQLGNQDRARKHLREALKKSIQHNQISIYLQYGKEIKAALTSVLEEERQNIPKNGDGSIKLIAYLTKLLSAVKIAEGRKSQEKIQAQPGELTQPLTDREFQVLQHLTSGSTYQEIGDALQITENTVRSHIKNIYGKLGVNNRIQAVTRANELNLVNL
jgi:LuxR family maltose regulon positive regulatory protein